MSSYAEVYLRGAEIFSWRNEIDPTFLFLFTKGETRRWLEDPSDDNDYEPTEKVQLVATAAVLRDRLDVLGIGRVALNEAFEKSATDKLEGKHSPRRTVSDRCAVSGDGVTGRSAVLGAARCCRA
jgi:hypothetical protein